MTTIDDIYETVISKLTAQNKILDISNKLLSLRTNDERVLYVYDIISTCNLFPKVDNVIKSAGLSVSYRNQGNQCFKLKKYKAWQYYNLSLLYAPHGSEEFAYAISNRSAVLYDLEKFGECITDIETVFSLNYPLKLKEKLSKRLDDCKEKMDPSTVSTETKVCQIFDTNFPRDPVYVAASAKLDVIHSVDMGRHVVAKEDIKVGEVLVCEDPYFTLLLKSQTLFSCNYCLSRSANLMPCDQCCFALYCSEKCKIEAYKYYHSVECKIMATLIRLDFTKIELLALRTTVKARSEQSSWNLLIKLIKDVDETTDSKKRGLVLKNNELIYDSKYYESVHSLASNVNVRTVSDIFQKSVTSSVFLYLLKEHTKFFEPDTECEEVLNCVAKLLLHHSMTSPTNMHGICTTGQNSEGHCTDTVNLASAPYAFLSLINHSCAPNVVRMASKLGSGQMLLIALRPIKKGNQLFDNYGYHHALENRAARQHKLKVQYRFTCQCEACVNDWPTYLGLSWNKVPQHLNSLKDKVLGSGAIDNLLKGDAKVARELFPSLCDLAEKLEPFGPCVQLADVQESLKQCMELRNGFLPYGFDEPVEWWVNLNLEKN